MEVSASSKNFSLIHNSHKLIFEYLQRHNKHIVYLNIKIRRAETINPPFRWIKSLSKGLAA